MVDDLKALEERCSRGFEWLYQREQAGKTDAHYRDWLSKWEAMLQDYQARMEHLHLSGLQNKEAKA